MTAIPLMEDHPIFLKKLYYKGTHRGMREADVILLPLIEALDSISPSDLKLFDQFLDEGDQDILGWVMGTQEIPPDYSCFIGKIRKKV
jgi:succinate dehydrogenase flavin-adding protein (antitoxin of CptAB toxin-antitoxin module)